FERTLSVCLGAPAGGITRRADARSKQDRWKSVLKSVLKRVLISAFILFHFYIMAIWGMPGSTFRYFLSRPITTYVLDIGLWHSWDMFSPDPLAINFNLEAEILYQNGQVKTWTFPRMEKLGYWERFQKERYRKWRERVRLDMFSMIWDDTAR